jgi:hypothetical protein
MKRMVVLPISHRSSIGSIGGHSYHQLDFPLEMDKLTYHPYNPILSESLAP